MGIWEEVLIGIGGTLVLVILVTYWLPRAIESAIENHHQKANARQRLILADFAEYLSIRLEEVRTQRQNLKEYREDREIYDFKIRQVRSEINNLEARAKFTAEDLSEVIEGLYAESERLMDEWVKAKEEFDRETFGESERLDEALKKSHDGDQ